MRDRSRALIAPHIKADRASRTFIHRSWSLLRTQVPGKRHLDLQTDKHDTNTIGGDWIFRRTFQCATVGGPVTSQYSSSMLSLAALLRPRRSMSKSASWADFFDASGEPSPMLPLSRLLCLLEGGVSGMRGPGMFWGLEDSVGRRQAGV